MKVNYLDQIKKALFSSWSKETSLCFSESCDPSYGQCAPTAIIIQENFGGEIFKTDGWPLLDKEGRGRHFYNFIDGKRYDFTADQFSKMDDYQCEIEYKDILSNAEEAASETPTGQIESLRTSFSKAFRNLK